MKKLLSIILAIAIIATLMPTAFGAGAETKKIEYVFSFNAYADENGAQNNTSFQKGDLITKTQSRNMYSDHNAWSAAGFSWAVTAQLYKDSLFWNSATGRVSGNGQENDLLSAAMVLEINETGTFIPTLYYTPKTSSPIYNIYLVKKNEADSFSEWSADAVNALLSEYLEEKVSDASCIGTVDMWGSEKSASKELLTVNITEKGEYFLIFVDEGANSAWEALVDSKG
ncbi:MAG: hypothetical protein E7441_11940, partial [Ruminococcaceae bacterium]|nr:hypothetical protein [Oscillospiraceae bacterium]